MELRRGVLLGVLALVGCSDSPPGRTYYQRNIEPILQQKCAGNTSGCHQANADDPYSFAAGNFDVSSFDNVQKRRDLLAPFGAYTQPLLLSKAVAPSTPPPAADPNARQVQYGDQFLPLQVLHAGGAVLDVNSDAYLALQTWMQNGATANGLKPPTPPQQSSQPCSTAVPSGFNAAMYTSNPNYQSFVSTVQPVIKKHGCNAGNCHGAPQSDFYMTCGDDDTQLAVNAGGRGHTGGDQFSGTDDADYKAIHDWAMSVGVLDFAMGDPVKQFFKDNVQPILLQRGCSFMACHSPAATNDFKLRSGTQGFFSAVALEKNYELLQNEFMAVEFPDARRGRAVAKGILFDDFRLGNQIGGIAHRGGSVLETPGAGKASDPAACGVWAPGASPFCTIQEWITRERAALGTAVSPMNQNDAIEMVFVDRPAGQAAYRLQFDTFQGGADLKHVPLQFGANFGQQPAVNGAPAALLGDASCAGAAGGDIGGPDVANDGDSVAFAARPSQGVGWSIWKVSLSTGVCTQLVAAQGTVDNFDPAWSPDGQYIVFASTRGKNGPSLSRKRFLPQADIWRMKLSDNSVEQMTFLSNTEMSPQFMREGRMTMTTEKVSQGFYQLSGRRLNWDLTDYHPLLAQRNTSAYADLTDLTQTKPSIGYDAATDIREGNDGNFMLLLSAVGAAGPPVLKGGAGALGIFNRSIGPFETGRTDPGYLPSLKVIGDPAATGHTGATAGYSTPIYLHDWTLLASYAPQSSLAWKLVAGSPRTGQQTDVLVPGGGRAVTDAVLAYKYPARAMYDNRRQLVFGGSQDPSDQAHAVVHMPDAPMVFTVLTGNLRRGRPVDAFRKAKYLVVSTAAPCPPGACSANTMGNFELRTVLGKAPLAADGSVKVQLPAKTGVILELQDDSGNTVVKMSEEHQLGPGEHISMGISEKLFDSVCGGCHGSVSGKELDIAVTPDALTGASQSASAVANAMSIGN